MSERLVPTAQHTTGPFFPAQFIRDGDNDLAHSASGDRVPGDLVFLHGRVVDVRRAAVVNAIVEIWQADADGNFARPGVSGGFRGWGRAWTDDRGEFWFLTIKPGSTAQGATFRAPHVALRILGSGIMRPLVTQVFFPNEPWNGQDPQLALISAGVRERLIARPSTHPQAPRGATTLCFDIVLRGEDETPFLED